MSKINPNKDPWATRMTLLANIQDPHNEKAWEQFIETYSPFVLGFLHRLNLNHHEKEEFHQKVFTKLWELVEKKDFPEIRGRFRAWFKTVIHNEVKNYFRNKSLRSKKLKDIANQRSELCEESEIDQWVEEEWAEFVTDQAWKKIEHEFNDSTKQVFLMYVDGLKAEEIAEKLNLKTSSVYVYRKRVGDRLKQEVDAIHKSQLLE
jgi:RNA polymerase sigma factor (sigma-70 family)